MDMRRGFTITEVLTVIAVIALLMALILPAVQHARETGRRNICCSNLSQLGRALHGFASAHGTFPAAVPARPSGAWYAPHVFLLPYLDEQVIYRRIDVTTAAIPAWNPSAARRETITVFLCPTDANNGNGRGYPGNNYRVNLGPGPYCVNSLLSPGGGTGAFTAIEQHSPAAFTDGLAFTVAMAEKLTGSGDNGAYSRRHDPWYSAAGSLLGYQPALDDMVAICDSLSGVSPNYHPFSGGTWFHAGYENTWYNHSVEPNSAVPDCSVGSHSGTNSITPTNGGVFKANSDHPGGVNCLFMDGSARFVEESVDLKVWRAAATRSGHEISDGSGM